MKTEEYKQKLKDLCKQHEADKKELNREFALSNNPYKVGDKVTDHSGYFK